jgi:hypothetical protein
MRDKIFGTIGLVWGGAIVLSTLVRGLPSPDTSYSAGQFGAFLFGLMLLGVGAWTLRRPAKGA